MAEHQGDAYAAERALLLLTFGENVRGLRRARGLAQEGFAEVANVHRNEIGMIERGQCEPGLLVLLALADTFEDGSFWELLKSLPVPRERRSARCPTGPHARGAVQR